MRMHGRIFCSEILRWSNYVVVYSRESREPVRDCGERGEPAGLKMIERKAVGGKMM
jgi:hypothetical protein